MKVNSLKISGFRNIEELFIEPIPGVNVIYGENAQGKTNLLESIWLFTGCKSFRGAKDSELTGFEKDFARVDIGFFAKNRNQKSSVVISDKRRAELNGVKLKTTSALAGEFCAVVFSPEHLSLVKAGPAERRKFLDTALCQLRPKYAEILSKYRICVNERNSLLRDIEYHSELYDTLEIWDEQVAVNGAILTSQRMKYVERLREASKEIYEGLSSGAERFDIKYISSAGELSPDMELFEIKNSLRTALKASFKEDIASKTTSAGAHRDDLFIGINGISARNFGSQGQQRSSALALKLGEAQIITDFTGEKPVALLDDVMSELDVNRQDYILNHIDSQQVFITCCEPSSVLRMCDGKAIHIKAGGVIPE
ncbi:MAG: DNA replication/repair protein RecF [Clostridiales bacterium]|nr:DNA replication/repair protein RecF [Clostridiales bacterium]